MWKQLHHKQNGQIVVVVPIALLAFVGMVALVVNVGIFKLIRSEMQNAADAAALAAVWYDRACPVADSRCASDNALGIASSVARNYANNYNGGLAQKLCGSAPVVDPQYNNLRVPRVPAMTVVITCDAGVLSGGVLGIAPIRIWATSTAAIGIRTANGDITDWAPSGVLRARLVP